MTEVPANPATGPDGGTPARPSPARRPRLRWSVRLALLAGSAAALLAASPWAVVVPAASPLTAICSLLTTWTMPAVLGIGLAVGLVALASRRWFCRWVCPTGTCADTVSRVGLMARRRCPRMAPVGQWTALATIGGAALGYPVLLWLDPLAMFANAASLPRDAASPALWCGASALAAVLAISLVWPGIWCLRLCPLGGLQDVLASIRRGSGRQTGPRVERRRDGLRLSRRVVLGAMAGAGLSAAVRPIRAAAPTPLRPPGALDEELMVGVCIRCGNCLRTCPAEIIRPAGGAHGIAAVLSPVLNFQTDYCREDCVRCTEVCPSGALVKLTLEAKPAVRLGLPRVDMAVCLLGDDRDCAVCRTWCPYEAIKYVFCEDPDVYTLVPRIDPARCNGCGACQAKCPTDPTPAIVVEPT